MTAWDRLSAELDAWAEAGREATFWWRDDDATEATADLERLLDLAEGQGVALTLAVIPARCDAGLAARLVRAGEAVEVVQHGYAHLNHAGAEEKKIELGPQRPQAEVLEELARGLVRILGAFGPRALPFLVPPWNRIDPDLIPRLPGLGLAGLSTYGPRATTEPIKALWQTNTHVDIMRWSEPRGFLGEDMVLGQVCDHLRLRRAADGTVDPSEPTGLLTHHLAHDEPAWDFLGRLIARLAAHSACRFMTAREAFSPTSGGAA